MTAAPITVLDEPEDLDAPARYLLDRSTRGPWDEGSAHGGAPAALLTRAVERRARPDQRPSALTFTFLGPVPIGEVEVRTTIRKPGSRLQVVHAELVAGGRTAFELQAVLLRRGRVPMPAGHGSPWPDLAPPEGLAGAPDLWSAGDAPAFFPTAIEIRPLDDGPAISPSGKRDAWVRLRGPLITGEAPSGAQRAAAASDFASGLSAPLRMDEYLFANAGLHLSLHRDPAGEWIGLRARTELDGAGTGLTTTELHDAAGRFGVATQTLVVEHR